MPDTLRVRALLTLGLLADATRWHLGSRLALRETARTLGYQLRPYCWQRDAQHWRWPHRRCRCRPAIVVTLSADTTAFEQALARLMRDRP